MRKIWLWILTALLIPIVSADLIMPLNLALTRYIPFILILEFIIFWALANKVFNIKIGLWKSLLIVFLANLVTYIVGMFLPVYNLNSLSLYFMLFVVTSLIEFGVFYLFFIKKSINKLNLLWISLIANAVGYLLIYFL